MATRYAYTACNYCTPKYGECDSCTSTKRNMIESRRSDSEDDSSFLTSAAVAAATDSTLLGWAAGGDLLGAALGDSLFGDD